MKRLRFTLVVSSLGPGGAERVLTTLANAWAARGNEVTILTFQGLSTDFYQLDPLIRRGDIGMLPPVSGPIRHLKIVVELLKQALRLRGAIKASRPDVVLSFIDVTNVTTLLALIGTAYPRIVSERSDPAMVLLGTAWRTLRRIFYLTADRIVVLTEAAAQFFRGWSDSKVAIIPNPVVHPRRGSQVEIDILQPAIVALGRFTEEKRFEDLIDAFAIVAPRHRKWSLIIGGDGPLRPVLQQKVDNLGLRERIVLPGLIKDTTALLECADIYVLSSRFEGFGNALCEAMALGRPVIATDCPSGPRTLVSDGIDGILVPPMAPLALAGAIDRLICSPDERERLGRAAAAITKRFALETVLADWERVLTAAIEKRGFTASNDQTKYARQGAR